MKQSSNELNFLMEICVFKSSSL